MACEDGPDEITASRMFSSGFEVCRGCGGSGHFQIVVSLNAKLTVFFDFHGFEMKIHVDLTLRLWRLSIWCRAGELLGGGGCYSYIIVFWYSSSIHYLISNSTKMKTSINACLVAAICIGAAASFSSCSKPKDVAGAWEAAPERVSVPGTADVSSTVTLDFAPSANDVRTGQVNISSVISLQQMASTQAATLEQPWEVTVAATATANGTYTFENGEDDEILIAIDPASVSINVDPAGVTFVNNPLTGVESSYLDSLTNVVANQYKAMLTAPITNQFSQFRKIDDIEIHNGTMMSAEIGHKDIILRKVGSN